MAQQYDAAGFPIGAGEVATNYNTIPNVAQPTVAQPTSPKVMPVVSPAPSNPTPSVNNNPAPTYNSTPTAGTTKTVTWNMVTTDAQGRILTSTKSIDLGSNYNNTTTKNSSGAYDYTQNSGYTDYLKSLEAENARIAKVNSDIAALNTNPAQFQAQIMKTPDTYVARETKGGELLKPSDLAQGTNLKESDIARVDYGNGDNRVFRRSVALEQAKLGEYQKLNGAVDFKDATSKAKFMAYVYAPKSDLSSFTDTSNIGKVNGASVGEGNGTDLTGAAWENKVDYSADFQNKINNIANNLSENNKAQYLTAEKALEPLRKEVEDLNARAAKLMDQADTTIGKLWSLPVEMEAKTLQYNIDWQMKVANEVTTEISSLMRTVKDAEGKDIKILSRQDYGAFAGLYSIQQSALGYAQTAQKMITDYYGEKRLQLATQADLISNTLSQVMGRKNEITAAERDYIGMQVDAFKAEQTQINAKENILNNAIANNPQAYTYSGINPDDDYNTILSKLGKGKAQYDTFNELIKKYPKSQINPSMSIEQMMEKVKDSPDTDMSDAQILSRAKNLVQDYQAQGKYITYGEAEDIVRSGKVLDVTYGKGFYDSLRLDASNAINRITDDDMRKSFLSQFDAAIKQEDPSSAIDVINNAVYAGMDVTSRNTVDTLTTTSSQINNGIGVIDKYSPWFQTGTWTKLADKTLTTIGASGDKRLRDIASEIWLAVDTYKKQIYGSQITESERASAEKYIPNLDVDTLSSARIKLVNLQNFLNLTVKDKYTQRWGIDTNNDMSTVVSTYEKWSSEAKRFFDDFYKANPYAQPSEALSALQNAMKPSGLGEKGTTNQFSWSSFRWNPWYQSVVTNALKSSLDTGVKNMATLYPQGASGGQCGTWSKTVTNRDYSIGDYYYQKQSAVDSKGILKNNWTKPEVGQTLIFNEPEVYNKDTGTWEHYGHVAVINQVLPDGSVVLSESNYYNWDERVTHDRHMMLNWNDASYNKLYWILPTKLK